MRSTANGSSGGNHKFDVAIECVWLLIIFAIPLYFNPFTLNAFYFSKALALVLLVCLMMGLVIARWILYGSISKPVSLVQLIKRSPLQTAAVIFGIIWIVSTLFSIMPYKSIWGNLAGTMGLMTNLAWIVFFMVIALNVRSRTQVFTVLYVLLASSGLVSLIGILQYIDPHVLLWFRFTGRVFSTDGNPLSLSAFVAMVLPITLAMAILAWYGSRTQRKSKIIFAGLMVLFGLQLGCLALAQYSLTLLSFIVGIFSFFALIGLFLQRKATIALSIVFLLVIAIVAAALLAPMLVPENNEIVAENHGAAVSTAEQVGLPTLSIRVDTWKGAANIIIQSPEMPYSQDKFHWLRRAIGYGPETFIAVSQTRFPATLKSQYTFDSLLIAQPENHYLYLGVTIGILGLLAFFGVLVIFAVIGVKSLLRSRDRETILVLSAFIAAVAQYCVHIFFNPSVVDPEMVLWTALGLTAAISRMETIGIDKETNLPANVANMETPAGRQTSRLPQIIVAILVIIGCVAAGLYLVLPPLLANMKIQKGLTLWQKDKHAALVMYQDATRLEPYQSYYYNFTGNLAFVMAQEASGNVEKQESLNISEAAYLKAIEQEPQMAVWYYRLADIDLFWSVNGNKGKILDALSLYEKADRAFPANAVILNKWAFALTLNGDYKDADAKVAEAEHADPPWIQNAFFNGLVQASAGNKIQAGERFLTPVANKFDGLRYFVNFCSLAAGYGKAPLIRDAVKAGMANGKADWIVFAFLGISDVYSQSYEEAVESFKQSAALVPHENRVVLAGVVNAMFSGSSNYQVSGQEIIDTLVNKPSEKQ